MSYSISPYPTVSPQDFTFFFGVIGYLAVYLEHFCLEDFEKLNLSENIWFVSSDIRIKWLIDLEYIFYTKENRKVPNWLNFTYKKDTTMFFDQ